jgi:ribosomal protein S12 methylthiotransferase accessory factor
VRALAGHGLTAFLFDLRPPALELPLASALLADDPFAPVPLTAGYACALRRDDALHGALLEAAQSRLTDIHGARDDLGASAEATEDLRGLARACRAMPGRRSPLELPDLRTRSTGQAIDCVLASLERRGLTRGAVVDLCGPGQAGCELPVHVVKVLLPGLRVSELL